MRDQPFTDPLLLKAYGCTCEVTRVTGEHEGRPYDRVVYLEPGCPHHETKRREINA